MKKLLFFLAAVLLCNVLLKAQNNNKPCPYYFTSISNADKTINYVFGLYVVCHLEQATSSDNTPYTRIYAAVINNSKTNDLDWDNYKVYILTKTGKLIRSYKTAATDGEYLCTYKVPQGTTHHQYFCFHYSFAAADIDKVWLVLSGDDSMFNLSYADDKS